MKRLIKLFKQGAWLKTNPYSHKTLNVYMGFKFVCTVRYATIDKMRDEGLLELGVEHGTTRWVLTEKARGM